jgi:hypothetical protein
MQNNDVIKVDDVTEEMLIEATKVVEQQKKEEKEKESCLLNSPVAIGVSVAVGALALYGLYKMFSNSHVDEDVGYLVTNQNDIR